MAEETKKCPFCAETIQAAAVVCRFCGRDLVNPAPVAQPLPAAAPAQKKRLPLIWFIVLPLIICVLPAWFIFSGSRGVSSPGGSGGSGGSSTHQIIYRISGTATRASLTYQNASGDTEQKDVSLPWQMSFNARPGAFLYLSAQNAGQIGSITCAIAVDGAVAKSSTSEGAYKIASCSGRL